jgi:uncharacterized protein YecA (UPF0149 family)
MKMIPLKEGESIPFYTKADLKKQRREKQLKTDKVVGRNEPCPCGSGLKYKKCCKK